VIKLSLCPSHRDEGGGEGEFLAERYERQIRHEVRKGKEGGGGKGRSSKIL